MKQFLYYSFFTILFANSIVSIVLIVNSIRLIINRKRKNNSIYISKVFLSLGYFLIIVYTFLFVDSMYIHKSISLELFDKNQKIALHIFLIFAIIGNSLVYMWNHYIIEILEDRFIYSHLFFGKSIINFRDINTDSSRYIFNFGKGKRTLCDDTLKLVLNDGQVINLNFIPLLQAGNNSLMFDTAICKLKIKRESAQLKR